MHKRGGSVNGINNPKIISVDVGLTSFFPIETMIRELFLNGIDNEFFNFFIYGCDQVFFCFIYKFVFMNLRLFIFTDVPGFKDKLF